MHHVTVIMKLKHYNFMLPSLVIIFSNEHVRLLCFLLDLYCTLEVDSFGYFVSKAKTRVFRDTTEPQWNEVSHQDISPPTPKEQSSYSLFLHLCHFIGV